MTGEHPKDFFMKRQYKTVSHRFAFYIHVTSSKAHL